MTLSQVLALARRWLWLVVACPLVAAVAAYGVSSMSPKLYSANVALLVRPAQPLSVTDPSVAGLTSDQVVATYAQLIVQRPMLEAVISELGLKATPEQLSREIAAKPQVGTTILNVTVTDRDPALARDIANRLVSDFLADVKKMQQQEATTPNARSTDNLIVISPAVEPASPVSPKPLRNGLMGLVAGLAVAGGLIFLLETLDNTIKDDDRLVETTGLVPIGHVPFERAGTGRRAELFALRGEPIAEAYKSLRTNILFTSVDKKVQVILVTSSMPGEGKSRTAANLAIALAQAGHRTALVDADLRRPAQHRLFGIVRNIGLTNLILQDGQALTSAPVDSAPNLMVVPSGPTPPNPSELLGSGRMHSILADLRRDFSYVVIDTPPVLAVTDAAILSTLADGCIVVIEHSKTPVSAVRQAVESLHRVDARILGAILNKVKSAKDSYYNYEYTAAPSRAQRRERPLRRPEEAAPVRQLSDRIGG